MTLTTGSRVGPYHLQDRVASTESGERFTASEPGLDRRVSMVVTPLPADQAGRDLIRARARAFAGLADARLLPVYGQGDDDAFLWLTTRHVVGRSLADVSRLEAAEAARLGGQLANQLAALAEGGLAPAARLAPEDVVIEGEGATARAWLVPDPGRATADSSTAATRALVRLLDERARRKRSPIRPPIRENLPKHSRRSEPGRPGTDAGCSPSLPSHWRSADLPQASQSVSAPEAATTGKPRRRRLRESSRGSR